MFGLLRGFIYPAERLFPRSRNGAMPEINSTMRGSSRSICFWLTIPVLH